MKSTVCTLFEGDHHYGVAALANSLHRAGFRGTLYAGYRGALPEWATNAVASSLQSWPDARALQIGAEMTMVFLPLTTAHHFANYKADFMLSLLDGPAQGVDALFYFDPDICVVCSWTYVLEWVKCGVALCEDVNSPLPEHHPRRVGWRDYYSARGMPLTFRATEYINSGFVGVRAEHRPLLLCWKRAMELMSEEIGSLSVALAPNSSYRSIGFAECFDRADQDALNVAVEATDQPVSVIGKEAMAFKSGSALIPHAIGGPKPWRAKYLRSAVAGVPPGAAHKAFWAHVDGPIYPYTASALSRKRLALKLASAIGRVVSRA